jgi:hypothetical protein
LVVISRCMVLVLFILYLLEIWGAEGCDYVGYDSTELYCWWEGGVMLVWGEGERGGGIFDHVDLIFFRVNFRFVDGIILVMDISY